MMSEKSDNFCDIGQNIHLASFCDFYEIARSIVTKISCIWQKKIYILQISKKFIA